MNFQSQSNDIKYSVTDIKTNEYIFVWEIRNFKSYDFKHQGSLQSPEFSTGGDKNHTWEIDIKENGEYLALALILTASGGTYAEVNATLIFSICGQENEKISKEVTFFVKLCHENEKRHFPDFVKKNHLLDEKNRLLINGTLTISCKLCYQDVAHGAQIDKSNSFTDETVSYVLESLFETKKLSDVKIVIGQKEFQAHKCILAARSRVFSAMFEHDMLERNESIIKIEDIDPKVMEEVLRFMYCGKINDEEPVTDLLAAANKYELEELKSICENKLLNTLNGENIGEMLIFADRCQAEKLKKHAFSFITSRAKDINFEKFKADVESHSPLLVDMLREFN